MTSPAKQLGYKEGDHFILNTTGDMASTGWDEGVEVIMYNDDDTSAPYFHLADDEDNTDCIDLQYVTRIPKSLIDKDPHIGQILNVRPGDKFIMNENSDDEDEEERGFVPGTEVSLDHDDCSLCPRFNNKDGKSIYLYWGQLKQYTIEVGTKVRVAYTENSGFKANTEGTVVAIDLNDATSLCYEVKDSSGNTLWHTRAELLSLGPVEEGKSESWPTKPESEWKEGDKGIVRSTVQSDGLSFKIGDVITLTDRKAEREGIWRGRFVNSDGTHQWVDFPNVEPIKADTPLAETAKSAGQLKDAISALVEHSSQRTATYHYNGESFTVTVMGDFEGETIIAWKDQWNDIQTAVAKKSLLTFD